MLRYALNGRRESYAAKTVRCLVATAILDLVLACGASSPANPNATATSTGGSTGGGGSATGGAAGTGGSAVTSGSSGGGLAGSAGESGGGGASGSSGTAGAGGGGTGGGSAGTTGTGGHDAGMAGGSAGAGQAGAGGSAGAPGSDGGRADSGPSPSIDDCFKGLRAGVGNFQDATKASADKRYRMRLALETGDRIGTSGSYGWSAIRFALETPEGVVCVSNEAMLATAYMGTHHNCTDVLTVTVGDRRYVVQNPDSAIDYGDPTVFRRPGSLTIFSGAQQIGAAIRLDTVSCNQASLDGKCRSGGPC